MQQTTGFVLSDRDICTDLLLSSKHLSHDYAVAEGESASPGLWQSLHQIHHEEGQLHQRIFQYMHQRGWYETPAVDLNLKQQVANLWSQKLSTLRSPGVGVNPTYPGSGQPYAPTGGQPYAQGGGYYGQVGAQSPGLLGSTGIAGYGTEAGSSAGQRTGM